MDYGMQINLIARKDLQLQMKWRISGWSSIDSLTINLISYPSLSHEGDFN